MQRQDNSDPDSTDENYGDTDSTDENESDTDSTDKDNSGTDSDYELKEVVKEAVKKKNQ